MDAYTVFKELNSAYPFIYKVPRKGYMYIGVAAYRMCSQEETEIYSKFSAELLRVRELKFELSKPDVKSLSDLLTLILSMGDFKCSDENIRQSSLRLSEALSDMNESELASLIDQKKAFLEALDYRDGAFYRHSKK